MAKQENDSEVASAVEHRAGSKVSAGGDTNTFTGGRPDVRTTGYPKFSSAGPDRSKGGYPKSGSGKMKNY